MMWSSGVSLLALVVGADIHGDLDLGMRWRVDGFLRR